MSFHKITITITTMKLTFFLLSLYAFLGTHHARTLHGDVIQMVTEALELQSLDETTYGRVPRTPPSPSVAPSKGQDTFGRDKPKAPPTPSRAPTRGEGTYGRVKPKTPPSPSVAPSRGQATYGGNNPNSETPTTYDHKDTNEPQGEVIEMITGEQEFQSLDQATYGRVRKTPPPSLEPSRGQETFGRKPKSPPSPSGAPSRGQGTYGRENPSELTYNDLTRLPPSAPTPPPKCSIASNFK